MYCANHPKVETALSCGRCSKPICTECSVVGAVGMLCRKCAFGEGNPLYKIRPERLVLSIVVGLLVGIGAGFLLQFLSGMFLLMLFILCPLLGGLLGQVILWAAGFKRGRLLEYIAGGSVVFGSLISTLLDGAFLHFFVSPLSFVIFILTVGFTASAAIGKIRYY